MIPLPNIDLLLITDLILKLYDEYNGTRSNKSNGKKNKFEYCFLIICRYLNLEKKKISGKFNSK